MEEPVGVLVEWLAAQLGIPAAAFADYAARPQTMTDHALKLATTLGLRPPSNADLPFMIEAAAQSAWSTDRGAPIVARLHADARRDAAGRAERRLAGLRERLPARGTVGYRSEPPLADREAATWRRHLAQYVLAPVVIEPGDELPQVIDAESGARVRGAEGP